MTTKVPSPSSQRDPWPEFTLGAGEATIETMQRWMQMIGKIMVVQCPRLNHWWNVSYRVTPRGLGTPLIPYGSLMFRVEFDFVTHELLIETSQGVRRTLALSTRPVAAFYAELMTALRSLGVNVRIWTTPVEVEDRTPFELDYRHASYDRDYAERFWRVLLRVDHVLRVFRSRFIGKASPVQFFWGSMDIATSRFSGRKAPPHPGSPNVGRSVMLEAYSHEVCSCGFWSGSGYGKPAFYSYAYPEPSGYDRQPVRPQHAFYDTNFREYILPYDAVRGADSPEAAVLEFLQTSYEAAANCGHWDREALEVQYWSREELIQSEPGRS